MRLIFLLPVIVLAGCAAPEAAGPAAGPTAADIAAVHQVTMSGRPLSWQELRVHPALMRRACAVGTLVNEGGQVVGYCRGGRQCRTNDWRPVEPGCGGAPEYRAAPTVAPSPPSGPVIDLAGAR